MKKTTVLIGNYGSGKTELSINMALRSAGEGKKTALIDLDVVNPYFRSSDQRALLENAGVVVVSPPFAGMGVDVPAVSAEVESAFALDYDHVVFDVGGDPVGATALGRYHQRFAKEDVEALFIVNIRRPLCNTAEDIHVMLSQIESRSRLNVTGLVNNANLARETTWQDLAEGRIVVEEAARRTGVPLKFSSGMKDVLEGYAQHVHPSEELFEVQLYMRPDWLDFK